MIGWPLRSVALEHDPGAVGRVNGENGVGNHRDGRVGQLVAEVPGGMDVDHLGAVDLAQPGPRVGRDA